MTEQEGEKILNTALNAGVLLLKSGAEIRRVEEVIVRIASAYGMNVRDTAYSISNGLMISYDDTESGVHLSKIKQVPTGLSTRLDHLVKVNQLSRDIVNGRYTVDEAQKALEAIEAERGCPLWIRTLAAGVSAFAFLFLFQGNFPEGIAAFFAGALSYGVFSLFERKLPRMVSAFIGGIMMTLVTVLSVLLFPDLGLSPEKVMLGAMMPLVPGLRFANGFRDFANGDYISGAIRLIDALVTFAALAAGAAVVFRIAGLMNPALAITAGADTPQPVWMHALMGFVATVAFSVLFQLPWKLTPFAGAIGMVSWMVYYLLLNWFGVGFATLVSVFLMTVLARIVSAALLCPVTGFLVPGIVPLVPGAALFFSVYYLAFFEVGKAGEKGITAIVVCGAMMLGISLAYAIPQKLFSVFKRHK